MSTKVQKSSKGTVQVRNSNNRLQLRFSHNGKRHCLSLGLPDTKENRKAASAKAKLIEADIAYDRFDISKYKRQEVLSAPVLSQSLSQLDELWDKFMRFKQAQCSPSTMEQMYKVFSNYVERLPTYDLERSGEIFEWVSQNVPPDSGKRFLTRLSACCKWAMQSGLITKNPFGGLAAQVKIPKGAKGNEIDPFTADERDRILEALKTDTVCSKFSKVKHSHYWPYAYFSFYTGARTSEIIALQWRHIELEENPTEGQGAFGRVRFEEAVVESADGRVQKKGLKTQERREFPINRQLYQFLMSIRPDGAKSKDLLFSAPNGGWLHTSNFSRRVWKPLLEKLSIRHRKVYACRHTFITLALQKGMPIPDIARLVGNSPKVILEHYAGTLRSLVVPVL